MSLIRGLGNIGSGSSSGGGSQPVGTAPSQVGSLTAGTPGTVTIPVTYNAASGTAPITYAGVVALHGSTAFTPNNGVFSASGGQFVGLSAGTAYDLQIIATNSVGSAVTTLLNISTNSNPVYVPPSPTQPAGVATRYDLVLDRSHVAPGDTVTGGLYPCNANTRWNGGSVTLTLANGSPVTVTLPSSGSAKVPVSFTAPSQGTLYITCTNTAGLYNPARAPLNVFPATSGSSQALGATLKLGDQAVHQRDMPAGSPDGFSVANTNGWGEVWVNTDRAVPALFARLFDARSAGASPAQGSGTALSGWVQVFGAVSAAATIALLLPAIRAKQIYLELATDAAGSQPVRVANRFAVGTVIWGGTRSQLAGYFRGYAMYAQNGVLPNDPWTLTAVSFAADTRYADTSGSWYRHDGTLKGDPTSLSDSKTFGESTSNGAMEAGRVVDLQSGMMLGFVGSAGTGGGLDQFVDPATGQPSSAMRDTLDAATGGKARICFVAATGMDNQTETLDLDHQAYDKLHPWVMTNRPTVAIVMINAGATGIFGSNGSSLVQSDLGHTRKQSYILGLEATYPHVVSMEDYVWNRFIQNHASGGSRVAYAREHMRLLLSAETTLWGGLQTTARGPTLATTAKIIGGLIYLYYKLNGAASLQDARFSYPDDGSFSVTTSGVTASDRASLVAVYPPGGTYGNGTAIPISGVTISTTPPNLPAGYDGALVVALSGSGPFPTSATVHFASDFGVSGGTGTANQTVATITDNLDPFGVGVGQHMRPLLDIAAAA